MSKTVKILPNGNVETTNIEERGTPDEINYIKITEVRVSDKREALRNLERLKLLRENAKTNIDVEIPKLTVEIDKLKT